MKAEDFDDKDVVGKKLIDLVANITLICIHINNHWLIYVFFCMQFYCKEYKTIITLNISNSQK